MATIDLGKIKPIWKGNYSSVAAYEPLDFVYYSAKSYVCTQNSTGNLPTDANYFSVAVDQQQPLEILARLLTVDGHGSGLDADLLDGKHASAFATAAQGAKADNAAPLASVTGFKNHIINGNFDVWQRGNSQTTGGYGSDDRWRNEHAGSTKTHSLITCTDTERALFNTQAFSRTGVNSVTGAGNFVAKLQQIEDVTKLAGKTVTLSFWAKAAASKNITVEFRQGFGTGGTPSIEVVGIGVQKFVLTTTWQKFTKTITLPSIVGKTLGTGGTHTSSTDVVFWFDAGTNFNSRSGSLGHQSGTFDIAQVQLEEGSVATLFEQRPIGLELSLCQRYYELLQINASLYGVAGMGWQQSVLFKQTKRTNPTIVIGIPTGHTNIGTLSVTGTNASATVVAGTVTASGSFGLATSLGASAEF